MINGFISFHILKFQQDGYPWFLKLFFKYTPFQQIGWWNVMSLTLILIELMKVKFIWHFFEMFVLLSIMFMHLWESSVMLKMKGWCVMLIWKKGWD